MRSPIVLLLATLACAAENPDALALELEPESPSAVPRAFVSYAKQAPAEPPPHEEPTEASVATDKTQPRLRFSWDGGSWAGADSCNFGVDLIGAPAISTDGRYVIHDRRDEYWESDGGEGWEDYHEQEPLNERGIAVIDREAGTTTWLPAIVPDAELPHHEDGRMHCRKLRPRLVEGIERLNAALPKAKWRTLVDAEEAGIRVLIDDTWGDHLDATKVDRSPIELRLGSRDFVLRRRGIEVIHREPHPGLSECNMPLVLGGAMLDVETGYMMVTVEKRCVCFGSESDTHFAFTLPEKARGRVAEFAEAGRAVLEAE